MVGMRGCHGSERMLDKGELKQQEEVRRVMLLFCGLRTEILQGKKA